MCVQQQNRMKMYRCVLVTVCILYLSTLAHSGHRKRPEKCGLRGRVLKPGIKMPDPTTTISMKCRTFGKCQQECKMKCTNNNCFAFRCTQGSRNGRRRQRDAKCELFLHHQSLSDFKQGRHFGYGGWRFGRRGNKPCLTVNTCFKPCDNNPCANQKNTECYVSSETSTYGCRCIEGYEKNGDKCQLVNPCDSKPCANKANSECVNSGSSFECKCVEGYEKDSNDECQQVNVEPVCSLKIAAGYSSESSLTITRLNECKEFYETKLKEQYGKELQNLLPGILQGVCIEESSNVKLTIQETPVGVTGMIQQIYQDGQECVNTLNSDEGQSYLAGQLELSIFGGGSSSMDLLNVVDGSGTTCPNLEYTDDSLIFSTTCVDE